MKVNCYGCYLLLCFQMKISGDQTEPKSRPNELQFTKKKIAKDTITPIPSYSYKVSKISEKCSGQGL